MKNKKIGILVVIGLLLISLGNIINHFMPMADPVHGFVVGIGLGVMILGLITMAKQRKRQAL